MWPVPTSPNINGMLPPSRVEKVAAFGASILDSWDIPLLVPRQASPLAFSPCGVSNLPRSVFVFPEWAAQSMATSVALDLAVIRLER